MKNMQYNTYLMAGLPKVL